METIAWVAILASIIVGHSAIKGRVRELPGDLSDLFVALSRGDSKALSEVWGRQAQNTAVLANTDLPASGSSATPVILSPGNSLANAAVMLGQRAKGYRFGATGPDYYDCSGLIWQACKKIGVYKGGRFTTFTILSIKDVFGQVSNPQPNDIVLWPTSHMGVVVGPNKMYSAMNPRRGIGYSEINGFESSPPIYLRIK
jgi:cell wall-associated NlpC family hydrolase